MDAISTNRRLPWPVRTPPSSKASCAAQWNGSCNLTLEQQAPVDALRFGGKAYNCAKLKRAGFPVPVVVPVRRE